MLNNYLFLPLHGTPLNFPNSKQTKHLIKNTTYFINDDFTIITDLLNSTEIEYVIPVVPIHLMASIISTYLKENSITLNPDSINTKNFTNKCNDELILSSNFEQGIVFMSYAKSNEICPDNCVGPPNFCPHFKREKSITITFFLRKCYEIDKYINISNDDLIKILIIIESYQLKPGLGGLKGVEVKNILKILNQQLTSIKNKSCEMRAIWKRQ